MEKIGKNHDKYKLMKDYIKKCPLGITISDDLQVLSIAVEYNLEIDLLLYDYETEYKEETKDLLNKLINKANEVYEISHRTSHCFISLASLLICAVSDKSLFLRYSGFHFLPSISYLRDFHRTVKLSLYNSSP